MIGPVFFTLTRTARWKEMATESPGSKTSNLAGEKATAASPPLKPETDKNQKPANGEKGRCIQLAPRTEDLLAYFDSVKIWLRPKDFAIYKILIVDPKVDPEEEEEGTTLIELGSIRVNRGVRADMFAIEVPEDTEIIRQPIGEEQSEQETLQPDETPR